MSKSFFAVSLFAITLALSACSVTKPSSSGESMSSIPDSQSVDERMQLYLLAQNAGFAGTYDEWLDSIKGADGTSILSGVVPPSTELGNNGDVYIDTMTWDFFVKTDDVWTKVGNIMGPQGDPGQDGTNGTNGSDGVDGQDGEDGLDGLSAYEIYMTYYPGYPGTQFDWINDLASNQLVITIHVDVDGGTPTDVKTTYFKGEAIGPLPTSTKTFYTFSGWSVDDQRIDETYYVISPITLVAQWNVLEGYNAIASFQDLINVNENLAGTYFLAQDLDLDFQEWEPIGSDTQAFSGTFDGNGHTITNLTITQTHTNVGLFANNAGTIKNLKLENVQINVEGSSTSFIYAGSLVAKNTGIVENIETLSGSLTARANGGNVGFIGGIIGMHTMQGTIHELINRVHVTSHAATSTGGLIGRLNSTTTISQSANFGNVSGIDKVGGLIGNSTMTTIHHSMNVGNVIGDNHVGGLVGQGSTSTTITQSVNRGDITGGVDVGGFIGDGLLASISYSMNIGTVRGQVGAGGFTGYLGSSLFINSSVNFGNIFADFSTQDISGIVGGGYSVSHIATYSYGRIVSAGEDVAGINVGTIITNVATFNVAFFAQTLAWGSIKWNYTGLDIANGVYPTLKDLPTA